MEIVGFCTIRKDATTGNGAHDLLKFRSKDCPVLEFNEGGDVLVLNPEMTEMCMFDKCDVMRSFECRIRQNIIVPAGLDFIGEGMYIAKCMQRNGGYNTLLRDMVIAASLMKGKFTDSFLWQNSELSVS